MRAVRSEQMRELDRRTIEDAGVPGAELMERAGQGVARSAIRLLGRLVPGAARVLLVAGKGNNGGDAFATARILRQWGYDPMRKGGWHPPHRGMLPRSVIIQVREKCATRGVLCITVCHVFLISADHCG